MRMVRKSVRTATGPMARLAEPSAAAITVPVRKPRHDKRDRQRLKVSLPVHVRPFEARFADIEDVAQVIDFTRDGIYFTTSMPHYFMGMRLIATFPYGDKASVRRRFLASVVRLEHRDDGSHGVAVRVLL